MVADTLGLIKVLIRDPFTPWAQSDSVTGQKTSLWESDVRSKIIAIMSDLRTF